MEWVQRQREENVFFFLYFGEREREREREVYKNLKGKDMRWLVWSGKTSEVEL